MRKFCILIVFILALFAMPFQADYLCAAPDNGNHFGRSGNNGNHYGGGKGGGRGHGVPDAGTTLTLLAVGMSALGMYSIFRGKREN